MFHRLIIVCLVLASAAMGQNFRQVDKELQTRNAARVDRGGRVRLEILGKDVVKDSRTNPPAVIDGNVHSRQVMTGAPYRFHIDLIDDLPIDAIHLIGSDYASEQTPKDIEVKLSDGTVYKKTLEPLHAQRGKEKPRQTIDVGGKTASWVEVTILNNHPGAKRANGTRVGWGGIGDIEVITSADLDRYMELVDYNADIPQDIRSAPPRADYSNVKVRLPKPIALGERPGIYMTDAEWQAMFETMRATERGKPTVEGIISMANNYLPNPVVHPDPSVPAQLKSRGDAAAKAHDALAKEAGIMGLAYRMTGDEKYAARAKEILVGYAKLYPDEYKEHKGVNGSDTSKVMAQRLSEAMWIIPLIQSYDHVADSKSFTDADRRLVEEDLIRHCITFINRKTPAAKEVAQKDAANPNWRTDPAPHKAGGGALGNWTAFYNMAFIQGGSVLGDKDWIDLGAAGLKYMLENGIGEDGMWGEGAIGYQQFARHAMVGGLEALARKGIDLWGYKTNAFKNLFDSEFAYAYPDGTSPGINDSGRAAVGSGWTAMAFDYAYLRYGDPNYAHTVNGTLRQLHQSSACYFPTRIYKPLDEVPVEGQASVVFDKLGYAILRGSDGGHPTFMLMDYGPHGGVHGHPDKLNLILFADGDELAGEPRMYRYEDARHGQWTKTTIAHWNLSVDGYSQNATTGRLICFADEGDIKVMRGQAAGAYPGVAIDRTAVQMPGYIIDVYRAWGPAKHMYDYPLCFRGDLDKVMAIDATDTPFAPMAELSPGYMHINAIGPTDASGGWTGTWHRTEPMANQVTATVLPAPGTQVFIGKTADDRHQAILRRTGKDATFIAVIDPYKATDAVAKAEQVKVDSPVPAHAVKVTRADGGMDLVIIRHDTVTDGNAAGATKVGDVSTQALVTAIRYDKSGKQLQRLDLGGAAKR